MEQFITENLGNIIVISALVVVAITLFFAAKGKYRKTAKQILLALVMSAEKKFGGGTGEVKFAMVADALYERMPFIVQILFSEKDIANMIEDAVCKMKSILAENPKAAIAITGKEVS